LAAPIPASENGVLVVRFNNHGTILAAVLQIDGSFSVQFYDTRTLLLITAVRAHLDLIYEIAFSHQDALLLSVSADGMAKVWDVANYQFNKVPSDSPGRRERQGLSTDYHWGRVMILLLFAP
jgi:WD40 repeat protein